MKHKSRLEEAIAELRKEVYQCRNKFSKKEAKDNSIAGHFEAIKLLEWANGIEWSVDTIEYYLENGRMP